MSWDELLERYTAYLVSTHRSEVTLRQSTFWVRELAACCANRGAGEPAAVRTEHVRAYEQELLWTPRPNGRLYSPSSVQNALGMVRLFFRWAVRQGFLLMDPSCEVVLHQMPKKVRRVLSEDDIRRLLDAPDEDTLEGIRDRAILETFYGTGLRRRELYALDIDDLSPESFTLAVRRAKGGVWRLQPIGETLLEALTTYLQHCRPQLLQRPAERALFLGVRGGRLHYETIGKLIAHYGRQAGLSGVTPHQLRHCYATHLLGHGARLHEVRELLGHKKLESTNIYTHLQTGDAAREHRRTHPRARRKGRPGRESTP